MNIVSFFVLMITSASVTGFTFNGATKPLGYFDPFGFANGKSQNELIKLREAELKHGRWGMISAVGIPITELVTHKEAIHVLDTADSAFVNGFVSIVALYEFRTMLLGWENPFTNSSNYFTMKADYQPGDLGLGFPSTVFGKDEEFLANAELNHGRLAMIGALGMIAQELVTDRPLF
jgi:hypothetical protein